MAVTFASSLKSASGEPIVLSDEQAIAFADMEAGRNVLVTGAAGTGKSTLLMLAQKKFGSGLAVTASTGIAALNIGGTTIHTFAGLGMGKHRADTMARNILGNKSKSYHNITRCKVLALDEISMISADFFNKIDQVFRLVRRCDAPFGGVQLILLGDFCQAPPVSKRDEPEARFAFFAKAWAEAGIHVHVLTRVYRQSNQAFSNALGRLRVGDIYHPDVDIIATRVGAKVPDDGIRPTIIHTHNVDVDRINAGELAKLPGDAKVFRSLDTGKSDAKDRLDRDCLAAQELALKVGAQVMMLANVDIDAGLVNGRLGVITELDGDIKVRFGDAVVRMERWKWNVMNNNEVLATREQYPLRLAYAITTHKSQSLTLDRIECHMARVFAPGLAYVAISRVKTLEGLFLRNTTRKNFTAHPDALAFYENARKERAALPQMARQEEMALGN